MKKRWARQGYVVFAPDCRSQKNNIPLFTVVDEMPSRCRTPGFTRKRRCNRRCCDYNLIRTTPLEMGGGSMMVQLLDAAHSYT